MCYYKSTSVPRPCDCPPILTFQLPNYGHNDKLMWEVRGDQAGGFWEGLRASPGGAVFSSALLNSWPHTDVAGLRFQRFYIVWAFQKQTLTGKGLWEPVVFSAGSFKKKKSSHLVFLFMRKSWWEKNFFFSFFLSCWNCGVWGEREEKHKERQHWKQHFLKRPSQCRPCAVIWSVLTELSRGMEKIIRRNVWGALKRSGPRDWPIGVRPAERRANFFLMNSTACSTMQSDCQGWTHIWSVFGGSKWQDQFCLQRKGGVGVGRRWLLLAPPSFFFFFFYFIRVGCGWMVV